MTKEELAEYLKLELYMGYQRTGNKLFDYIWCRFFRPNSNAVYHIRKMLYFNKKYRGGLCKLHSMILIRRYGININPESTIGKGLYIVHPTSICMTKVRIGENFTIMQNCTLGAKLLGECDFSETPCVGNNVTMYANSIVIGNVKVADGVTIGCNSLVLKDADVPNGVYVGSPAYIIKKMEN